MFSVTETEAAAIRRVFEEEGELSAMIELRRYFPGITDNAKARECARTIAGWKPALAVSRPVTRLQSRQAAIGRIAGFAATACRYAECGRAE